MKFHIHKYYPTQFIECDTCRVKPGSPELCWGCFHNRMLISKLKQCHCGKIKCLKK